MTEHEFTNGLWSLFSIEGWRLQHELTKIEQQSFVIDPVRFYLSCDDTKRLAIWRQIEQRQKENA